MAVERRRERKAERDHVRDSEKWERDGERELRRESGDLVKERETGREEGAASSAGRQTLQIQL